MTEMARTTYNPQYNNTKEYTLPCGSGAQVEKDFEVNNEMENDCKLSDNGNMYQ